MALTHKGLHYRSMPTRFTSVPNVENGFARTIPIIRDGETLVADSFDIALYLDRTYPDRPSLFGGLGGEAMARFIERWSFLTIHAYLGRAVLLDIYNSLAPADRPYFRESREKRYGLPMEQVPVDRDARLAAFRQALEPVRSTLTYQPFLGGQAPLFSDYIVFGAFQWVRVVSPFEVLTKDDPVAGWIERCLDLHGGIARRVSAAVA